MCEELKELPQIDPDKLEENQNVVNNEVQNRENDESEAETEEKSKDNLENFKDKLKNFPEIFDYIVRQGKRIKKLEKKVKKLKNNIKKLRPKTKTKTIGTQTIDNIDEPKSLTDEIKQAAENAMHKTGFVYEPTSGMYYDYNTGYYYNAELSLYYDGNSGTYMTYNPETQSYDFHSQVSVAPKEEIGAKRKKPQKEQVKNYSIDGLLQNFSQLSIDHYRTNALEVAQSWPPCMRIILRETTIEKLKIGSLYIITCDGGQIGREGEKSIILPDINVSKTHAEITFDKESGQYMITDLGSQNGTILNGSRISAAKKTSEPKPIVHGSIIQFGGTKLMCHIHDGQQTCGHCEPGLIQIEKPPKIDSTLTKNSQHRKELRRLRKKFGLENGPETNLAPGYNDRAEVRRKTVGSQNEKEKTQTASVNESIASDNKGFKMLSKMGWAEGQSLGKNGTGLTEPVPLVSNEGTTGLGSSTASAPPAKESSIDKKASLWKKTQQRYQKVKEISLDAFQTLSEEEET